MKAVLMSGGKGVRLRPFTYVQPKPLLPVGPMCPVEYSFRYLKEFGVEEIIISINYLKEKFSICNEFSKKYNIPVRLVEEDQEMGTIGSLYLMKDMLDKPFIMLNGDLISEPPYKSMLSYFEEENATLLIGVKQHHEISQYGVIKFNKDGKFSEIVEKPKRKDWISTGIYIIDPSVINLMRGLPMDTPDLIKLLSERHKPILTYDIGEKWLDIGNLDDYDRAYGLIKGWQRS